MKQFSGSLKSWFLSLKELLMSKKNISSEDDIRIDFEIEDDDFYSVLALRDVVVYPGMVLPLLVGRPKSIKTLETDKTNKLLLLTQKNPETDDPSLSDLYEIGTVVQLLQIIRQPDGTIKVLVEGLHRAKVRSGAIDFDEYPAVFADIIEPQKISKNNEEALRRFVLEEFDRFVKTEKRVPNEIWTAISEIENVGELLDTIAVQLNLKIEERQQILETFDITQRANMIANHLQNELNISKMEKDIRGQVKRQMDKNQREYYLNEQIKIINKELGHENDEADFQELEKKIQAAGMSDEAKEKAMSELKKLKMMPQMSSESNIVRNYIETLIDLPWSKQSEVNQNIAEAQKILDDDHYGLEKVKERIVEYLAVQKRVNQIKGPILCLVGPPGVGKTSLGQSIAKATGREYVRMALGGVHDESEIRGHRRTYLGSMPGRVLQNMIKAGVNNPLFLLDEVDKLGRDYRGDPASALLEVLDPEQNHTFSDHYAEVDFDLSKVMFIATSNSLDIPQALLDRMEIIHLSGYTEDEKVNIAMQYLIPRQMKNNGLKKSEILITEDAVRGIIRYYTREAGVRSLDREIAKICRKIVRNHALSEDNEGKVSKVRVLQKNLNQFLGVERFDFGKAENQNRVGQVTGLAWTSVGGELLTIEAVALSGKGQVIHTGSLGDVMKESVTAALSVVRSRSHSVGIAPDFYSTHDLHVHFPEGATPKDGPSAGSAITLAIVSALTNIPVRADVAMTGEITLRGEILPIGGLKEKLLAALRGGIRHVLIPKGNVKDLAELPKNIVENLEIHPVQWIDEVFDFALETRPKPYIVADDVSEKMLMKSKKSKNIGKKVH